MSLYVFSSNIFLFISQKQNYKSNMILNRMKIIYIYLIKYMIIVGVIVQCIQPAFATPIKRVQVTEPPKQITVNASHLEEGNGHRTGNKFNYKVIIIEAVMMVAIALLGAVGWFLYYKLKTKETINNKPKGTEESQTKLLISKITWFTWFSAKCSLELLTLLYHKLRKKKPIYDEEKAIEKSQPKPSTTLSSKDKKKKTKKEKKNAPVNKSVVQPEDLSKEPEHVAPVSVISAEQEHEESASVSMPPIIPEVYKPAVESEKETCSKVKYKRITVLTWIEEITDDEDDEVSHTHQIKECQKEIPVALKPKMRQVTEPKKDPELPVATAKPKTIPDGLKRKTTEPKKDPELPVATAKPKTTPDGLKRQATEPKKDPQLAVSTAKPKDGLKASKKKTVKHEAPDIKPKPEKPTEDKLPVVPECQELPKPNCASQFLKDIMRNQLGTDKDQDPETVWKSILKGNGKVYEQKLESKAKISPKLSKELQEHFQKHRASKTSICTGVGSSDALLAHPQDIPGAYKTTLTRTYIGSRDKPIVPSEVLRQTIEDRQSRTQNQHEVIHVAKPQQQTE
ncbi:calpastatin-like [Xenopus tropicalis]|uniref:Calpastatin-like n=1 Tax=Xenopus tropicalis TaxID=8364 RepID=A0A8J1JJU9_XENTR|nr:calpastatin-like [Xenopus tropicalis]